MRLSGVVEKVRVRKTPHGSKFAAVQVSGKLWKFLVGFNPIPKVGDEVELVAAMPLVGFPGVNVGGVKVVIV